MRTRSTDTPKTAAAAKKTPPSRKSTVKAQTTPSSVASAAPESSSSTPKIVEPKRTSARRSKQVPVTPDSNAQTSVGEAEGPGEASEVTPVAKPVSGTRVVKKVVKRVVKKTAVSGRATKSAESEKANIEETAKESIVEDAENVDAVDNKPLTEVVGGSPVEDENVGNPDKFPKKEEGVTGEPEKHSIGSGEELSESMEPMTTDTKSMGGQTPCTENQKDEVEEKLEEPQKSNDTGDPRDNTTGTEGNNSDLVKQRDASLDKAGDEKIEGLIDQEVAKPVSGPRKVKKAIKRVVKKAKVSGGTTKSEELEKAKIEKTAKENIVEDSKNADAVANKPLIEIDGGSLMEDKNTGNPEIPSKKEEGETGQPKKHSMGSGEELPEAMEPMTTSTDTKSMDGQSPSMEYQKEELEEKMKEPKDSNDKGDPTIGIENNNSHLVKRRDASLEEVGDEKIEGLSDQEVHEEFGGEDFADDDVPGNEAETETLEEEHNQFNAASRERKVRKEREVFVGELGRDAVEEDIRRVFAYAGDVVEVRMHVDPLTNKNKGYAFVQFATKEQASRVLSEMKNPVIHGKRCATAPSEDNDTLFLGNICNTWTKEAIKQKLKDYGLEGVENINLVADPRHEGTSRGFAFVEFSCHAEAMMAYKRLQKPDVVFGHSERTAKVAFAEPLREPDPEVMAQVKSVFVDGIPPHWGEKHVREKFKVFGQIARIMLARNMSTAKRKDFGFVDFTTHEAAVSCVEGVNNNGLNDDNTKVKVRARLSNPLPKMQAVKGGMCGGFRIRSGTFPRSVGRGFGRGRPPLNRANFQYGQGFYPRGPGHGGRTGFPNECGFNEPFHSFHRRQNFGRGERWGFRGAHQGPRPYSDRGRHDTTNRGYDDYDSYKSQPYSVDEGYDRSFMGRHFDDPYSYDDVAHHGIKRPYYMMDHDHGAEPSRHRPRLNYPDPAAPVPGSRYQDDLGANGGLYSQSYYRSDYGGGAYSPYHGGGRAYGRDYYY